MSGSLDENSSFESAFPRVFAGIGLETATLAGALTDSFPEDPLTMEGAPGVSVAESEPSACAVACCSCSKKPGAPPAPGGGESGAAPVVEDPAPTKGETNTATE